MADKMARLGAAAFAAGLLLVGPQAAGLAAAERGDAGDSASAADNTSGSSSDDDSSDDAPSRSEGPEAAPDPAGEAESDEPDVKISVDESDVEDSVDESDVEDSVEETSEAEPVTESAEEDPPVEPVAEESTEVADPSVPEDQVVIDDPIAVEGPILLDDGVPGRGGPDPLPWWRTTTVEDSGTPDGPGQEDLCGDCETPDIVWNYSGPSDDDPVALPVAVPGAGVEDETPEQVADTANGPAGQVIAILKMKVVEVLDLALNWLSGLPSNQFTEFLSGALLLIRRTLLPDAEASQDTGGPGSTELAEGPPDGLVGLTESAAVDEAVSGGWVVRVVARDGEYFPVTLDYSTSRVNLTVVDGIVTSVSVG